MLNIPVGIEATGTRIPSFYSLLLRASVRTQTATDAHLAGKHWASPPLIFVVDTLFSINVAALPASSSSSQDVFSAGVSSTRSPISCVRFPPLSISTCLLYNEVLLHPESIPFAHDVVAHPDSRYPLGVGVSSDVLHGRLGPAARYTSDNGFESPHFDGSFSE